MQLALATDLASGGQTVQAVLRIASQVRQVIPTTRLWKPLLGASSIYDTVVSERLNRSADALCGAEWRYVEEACSRL